MYSVKDLLRPSNLEEALQMMKDHPEAMPLAGGTDVVVKMRKKAPKDVVLLSGAKIGEMKGIELLGDGT
ncbi:MAG: FAD binding domain-containing protein, partial [Lachnospiraceae bacterium]|nr:FAD binding domain-containing protein [Candidatus Equihabitans merdae]